MGIEDMVGGVKGRVSVGKEKPEDNTWKHCYLRVRARKGPGRRLGNNSLTQTELT